MKFFALLLTLHALYADILDLEGMAVDWVLETKQIHIPGYPHAFNPSIVRWRGRNLMCVRVIPDPKHTFVSWIGLIWLDDDFEPLGPLQRLQTRDLGSSTPSRAEDGRLILINDSLYVIYTDNPDEKISAGGFRVYIGLIDTNEEGFFLQSIDRLSIWEGEDRTRREKNWTPFAYRDQLLLAYSVDPHKIFFPLLGTEECMTVAVTKPLVHWDWGILRGGTPALLDESGEYLTFFHSCLRTESLQSGKPADHYFMGVYTFSREPPFEITRISPAPLVGKGFYTSAEYKPYWKPVRVVYPGGYLVQDNAFWVAYGKQDHEVWIAKIDRQKLLDSLIPVTSLLR